MRFFRSLLAVVFWDLALLAAAPAIPYLYPLAQQWVDFARGGEMPQMSADAVTSLSGVIPWLTLAGVFSANATLVRMLGKMDRW